MKLSDLPTRFNIPFANSAGGGYITYPVPEASQIGISDGRASLTDGFPPLNFLPVGAGGVPPFGQDENGILKQITAWSRWQAAGSPVPYNSAFSTAVGGYPKGALLASTSFSGFWISTVDDNTGNPDAGAPNWIAFYPYTQETLTANRTYYVATTGNDSNDGSSGSPWLTLQHAWDFVLGNINLNGYAVTVQVADGTYSGSLVAAGSLSGARGPESFVIRGNTGTPANAIISTTGSAIFASSGANLTVRGFQLASSAASGGCLVAITAGVIEFDTVRFAATTNAHVYASDYGVVNAIGSYAIVGGASLHYYANVNGLVSAPAGPMTVTLTGTPAFGSRFAHARISSTINVRTTVVTFSGAATGVRYYAELLGNIYTEGGGANFFPGNSAGSTATSGIYN